MFTAEYLCAYRFQVNCGLDSGSLSSPLDSPDVPITCSVATLQSAESLSIRRQVRLSELSRGHGQFNDLLVANPHLALMHTLLSGPLSGSSPDSDDFPDTPSAKVTPSCDSPPAYLLQECSTISPSPCTPSAMQPQSSDSDLDLDSQHHLQDFHYFTFYDEIWQMTKFEYDLHRISTPDFDIDNDIIKSELDESNI